MTPLDGAHALVTGASAGIGAATARALARRGARLSLLARSADALESVAAEIGALGGAAQAYPVDLSQAAEVERVIPLIVAAGGWPDIVIHSAGAGRWLYTEETPPGEAAAMLAVPYLAAFNVTRHCLPEMLRRHAGHLVIVNSPVVRAAWPAAAGYAAARYALYGFTRALWLDLDGTGVRLTSIVAGRVSTGYFARNQIPEARVPPLGRLIPTLSPEQVAAAVVHGLNRNRREIVLPFMLRGFFALNWAAPGYVEWALVKTGYRR